MSLTRKFIVAASISMSLWAGKHEIDAYRAPYGALADDYARAAQCDRKLADGQPCTDAELSSAGIRDANDSRRQRCGKGFAAWGFVATVAALI